MLRERAKDFLRPAYRKVQSVGFDVAGELRRCCRRERIIVSVASYPPRMSYAAQGLATLFHQSEKPDKVLLWLAESEFPNGLADLPQDLLLLRNRGLEIRFAPVNLKAHNKYYWTRIEYPDDIIITADDDILYRPDMVKALLKGYRKNPHAVSAMRAHRIRFDDDGDLLPYMEWQFEYMDELFTPRNDLIATGCCGVLYPPHAFDSDIMTEENALSICPDGDDLWLKFVELDKGIPVCVCSDFLPTHEMVAGSQDVALWLQNNDGGGNDRQIAAAWAFFDEARGSHKTLIEKMKQEVE